MLIIVGNKENKYSDQWNVPQNYNQDQNIIWMIKDDLFFVWLFNEFCSLSQFIMFFYVYLIYHWPFQS